MSAASRREVRCALPQGLVLRGPGQPLLPPVHPEQPRPYLLHTRLTNQSSRTSDTIAGHTPCLGELK